MVEDVTTLFSFRMILGDLSGWGRWGILGSG
jgi:hypothetical protein